MTKISGLSPFADDAPQNLRRDQQGVSIPGMDLRAPRLSPRASPVETYTRPAAPPRDTTQELVDSLATFNSGLTRFSSAYQEANKEDDTARANRILAGARSPEEVNKLIDTNPDLKTALGKAASMRFAAQQNAALAIQSISTDYQNGFDKQNGNFDAFAVERYKPFLDRYGDNPEYVKTFLEHLQPGLARMKAGDVGLKSQQQYDQKQQSLTDVFGVVVEKAKADGGDATAQAAALNRAMNGNAHFMSMPLQDQRKALAGYMSTAAAAGNYDLVNALANMKVKNPDGSEHTLLTDGYVGSDVAKLVKQAESARDDNNHKDGIDTRQGLFDKFQAGEATPDDKAAIRQLRKDKPGIFTENWMNGLIAHNDSVQEQNRKQATRTEAKAQLTATFNTQEATLDNTGIEAVKSGKLFELPQMSIIDKEGNPKTLTQGEFRKRAVEAFQKESARIAQKNGETWQQTVQRELPVYAQNGEIPPNWKDTMTNGVNALSIAAASGQNLPEPTMRAYEMYKLLRANKAVMLRDLIPSDKAEVFEDAMDDETRLGLDPAKAMMAAVDSNNDPTGKGKEFQRVGMKKVQEMASSGYIEGRLPSWLGGNAATENGSYVSQEISRVAQRKAARGISPEKAIDQAAERFKNTHVNVNGWWIDASDKRLPANFSDLANARIEDYVARFGKAEGVDISDLTIRETGNGYGAWVIVRKGGGNGEGGGIPVDNWKATTFTARDLQETAAGLKKDALTQSAQRARDTTVKTESYPQGRPEGLEKMPYMNMVPQRPTEAPLMDGARRDPKMTTGLIPKRMKPRTLRQQYGLDAVEYED